MFSGMKKRMDATVATNDIETVIGKNTKIKGEISGSGNLRIDGSVEGTVSVTGSAVIGESGQVLGDVKATDLIVSGCIQGNADVQGSLCIKSTGQLVGDVRVKSLNVEDGGIFKGRSEMQLRTAAAQAPAAEEPAREPEKPAKGAAAKAAKA